MHQSHKCTCALTSKFPFMNLFHRVTHSLTQVKKNVVQLTRSPEAGLGDTGREESSDVWDSQCLTGELSKQTPSGGS